MDLRKTIFFFSLLALCVTLAGGYVYFSSARKLAMQEEHRRAEKYLQIARIHLATHIELAQKEAALLASIGPVQRALNNNLPALAGVNPVLDLFQQKLKVDVCYLLDDQGLTIASSNRNSPASFVGRNYGFRPYFLQAIKGAPAVYLALGVTSGQSGIYYSHPVYIEDQEAPAGVVVIKSLVDDMLDAVDEPERGIFVLSDPHGVIFQASHKDWLYKLLWQASPDVIAEIEQSRQFGRGPWNWVGMVRQGDMAVDAQNNKYMVHQDTIEAMPGWQIIYFHDLSAVSEAVYGPLFKTAGSTVLVLCLIMAAIILYLYRMAHSDLRKRLAAEHEKSQVIVELQEAMSEIKTLRGILPICSYCKQVRDDEGFWSQVESYIGARTEAQFSHGICPDCMAKHFPDILDDE